MPFTRLDSLPDILIFEPIIHNDDRGYFFEGFQNDKFQSAIGRDVSFVQDNQSFSHQNVLRGLHYQLETPQAKLVRVLSGEIFDVAVDIRQSSPTFGQWVGAHLSAENRKQIWIPEGFAHGFLTLSPTSEVLYKVSAPYTASHEHSILWNDPTLNIQWPLSVPPILSAKDKSAPLLNTASCFS